MKKLLLVLCIISLAFSCSKDDDANYSSSDLVGTWTLTSYIEDGEEYIDEADCPEEITFTKTTSVYKEYYGDNCESLYKSDSDTYAIDGKNIIIDSESGEILELTSKRLKVKFSYEEEGKIYSYVMTFSKK